MKIIVRSVSKCHNDLFPFAPIFFSFSSFPRFCDHFLPLHEYLTFDSVGFFTSDNSIVCDRITQMIFSSATGIKRGYKKSQNSDPRSWEVGKPS